jgi:hypothetical protein
VPKLNLGQNYLNYTSNTPVPSQPGLEKAKYAL